MRIFLAEDDRETLAIIERGLSDLGHAVVSARDGREALRNITALDYDVIVLDRMLPGLEGLEILRRIRAADVRTPVLVLTAKGGIDDRVDGLEAGADDYLIKPFAMAELVARLNALARRPLGNDTPTQRQVGEIAIDLLRREVVRAGRPIHLQPREFALLEFLMRHAGRIVTRTMLLEQVWGFDFDPETNIVESHLSRMRAKLRTGFVDDPIETIRGAGYRMRADG